MCQDARMISNRFDLYNWDSYLIFILLQCYLRFFKYIFAKNIFNKTSSIQVRELLSTEKKSTCKFKHVIKRPTDSESESTELTKRT